MAGCLSRMAPAQPLATHASATWTTRRGSQWSLQGLAACGVASVLMEHGGRRHRPNRRLLILRRLPARRSAALSPPSPTRTRVPPPRAYSASINWGDGSSSAGTITGGNGSFSVTDTHAYNAGGARIRSRSRSRSVGTNQGSSTVNDSADDHLRRRSRRDRTRRPRSAAPAPASPGPSNPNGLTTTAFFQYGLDPKYIGRRTRSSTRSRRRRSRSVRTSRATPSPRPSPASSPTRCTTSGWWPPTAPARRSGPMSHSRRSWRRAQAPRRSGKTFNIAPVSGVVLVKLHGVARAAHRAPADPQEHRSSTRSTERSS